jgi:hypothetical protein
MNVGELLHEAGNAVRIGLLKANRRAVECEDGGLLKLSGHLLPHEEPVLLLVHMRVKLLGQLVVPVDLEPDGIEHVESPVGVAREK